MNKNILAGSIGTLLEWAEFTFYAYLAYKFAALFFPMLQPGLAVLASFGTFAISYIARPIGGIIFGHIGDKYGRKKAFLISIWLMAIVTLLMGLLPTYNTIGITAPIILIILRFFQGISVSGEFTGAAIYILENDNKKPYLSSSWVSTSSAAGMLCGAIAALVIALPGMPSWAWRVPFCVGFIACLLAIYIRQHLTETTEYQQTKQANMVTQTPFLVALKHYKKPLLQTMSLAAFVGIYIYTCNIWWVTYVIQHGYFSVLQAKTLVTIGQGSVVIFTPLLAIAAERYGGKLIMNIGFTGAACIAPLLFWFSSQQYLYSTTMAHIAYAFCNAAVTANMFKFLTDAFPASIRCTGQAVGWNFSVAIFAGTAPLLAQYAVTHGLNFMPMLYVSVSALIAWISCSMFLPQKEVKN